MSNFLKRIKENFKTNKIPLLVLIIIWIAVVAITLSSYKSTLGKQSYGNIEYSEVVELNENNKVKEIVPTTDKMNAISLKIATYARKNTGSFHINVIGTTTKKEYLSKDIDISNLQDNAFLTIELDNEISVDDDKYIEINLDSKCKLSNAVGVYYINDKQIENSKFSINNESIDGDLTVRFLTDSEELSLFYRIIIIWTVSAFSLIILILLLVKPKYEILFAIIAGIIGITFCFIMTPMSIPDETAHFEYSFQMSNYMMLKEDHRYVNAEYVDYGSYMGHMNVSSAYKKVLKRFNSKLALEEKEIKMENDLDDVYSIYFIPQGLGITVARILNLNRVKTFYLGRLFNLAFYVACIYLAIKKTPMHKLLFGIIATLPMFMQQAASYSYDCFINGLVFVVIAYLLKFKFVEERITTKEIITIVLTGLVLGPAKIVYGFFLFLFFLVPYQRYGSKKKKILVTLLMCASSIWQILDITIPIIIKLFSNISELKADSNLIQVSTNKINTIYEKAKSAIFTDTAIETVVEDDVSYISIGDMVRDPISAFMIFFRTIRFSFKNWFYDSLGRTLSGVSLILPTTLVHLLMIPLFLSAFRKESIIEPISLKIIFVCLAIIVGIYILGGFLLSWTDLNQEIIPEYGGVIIQGIQGRYFCPLLPFIFTIFNNKKICIPEKFDKYIIFGQLLIIFEVIVYILSYTFVN